MLGLLFDYEAVLLRVLKRFTVSEHGQAQRTVALLYVATVNALYAARLKRYIQLPPHHCG
jgi:hypothetical protein